MIGESLEARNQIGKKREKVESESGRVRGCTQWIEITIESLDYNRGNKYRKKEGNWYVHLGEGR